MTFPSLTSVHSLGKYKLQVKFDDGVEGLIDLNHLAHQGVFEIWEEKDFFDSVYIDKETGAIAWNDQVDLCPDTFYLDLKKITFEEWRRKNEVYAYN